MFRNFVALVVVAENLIISFDRARRIVSGTLVTIFRMHALMNIDKFYSNTMLTSPMLIFLTQKV